MLRLDPNLRAQLLAQPESGMGYQVVEATTVDYKLKRGVAYNAELLLFEDEPRLTLKTTAFARLLNEAKSSAGEFKSLRVVTHMASTSSAFALKETAVAHGKKGSPAKDAPIEKTKEKETFKRFSAYEKDNRVRPDGSLLPGTYATTEEDAKNVRTGKEAVARYALPNPPDRYDGFWILRGERFLEQKFWRRADGCAFGGDLQRASGFGGGQIGSALPQAKARVTPTVCRRGEAFGG